MLSCADVLRDVYDSGLCKSWASAGECEVNAAFMFSSCAGACHAAGARKKAYSERCPRTNSTDTLAPGDLLSLFARAVSDFPELSPSLLSPSPPIAVFDNFLSAPEIEALLKVGRSLAPARDTSASGTTQPSVLRQPTRALPQPSPAVSSRFIPYSSLPDRLAPSLPSGRARPDETLHRARHEHDERRDPSDPHVLQYVVRYS